MVKASEVTLVRTLKTYVAVEVQLHALLTSYVCVCVRGGAAVSGASASNAMRTYLKIVQRQKSV